MGIWSTAPLFWEKEAFSLREREDEEGYERVSATILSKISISSARQVNIVRHM